MKTDYTLTPEWKEAFRMEVDRFLRYAEEETAKRIAENEAAKEAHKLFEDNMRKAQEKMIRVMNAPFQQLAQDIRDQEFKAMAGRSEKPSAFEIPGHDFTMMILRQAFYFLLLMLAVGMGLAVFL